MSKWSHLEGTLPPLPEETGGYHDTIRALCAGYRGTPLATLTERHEAETLALDALKAQQSEISQRLEALTRVIEETMAAQELESVVIDGYRWTRTPEPYPTVKDKAANLAWARIHMPDALALHASTLKAVCKDALTKGDPLPDGVEVFLKPALSRRKSA